MDMNYSGYFFMLIGLYVVVLTVMSGVAFKRSTTVASPSCGMLKTPTFAMRYEDIRRIQMVEVKESENPFSSPGFYVHIQGPSAPIHTEKFSTEEQASAFLEETYTRMKNCR